MMLEILNGLGICSDLDWYGTVTFPAKKTAFYGNIQDIATSLLPAVPVKRIDIRTQNALTVCNVALDSVVSDIFGKSSTSIIGYLLEQLGTTINHEEIASKLLKHLKAKKMQ